ncbi:MAG: integration host factor subunit alpha [Desulfobacterales bacterium]|nr:MAG: integration host factor subunit alpha [Desulfobacterales bacterium]
MKQNLTRKELAQAINEKLGISQRSASELVDLAFLTLKQTLLNEESIKLVQFGTCTVRNKAPRMGRNPRTGEAMEIAKRSMVLFKASKSLRQKINS